MIREIASAFTPLVNVVSLPSTLLHEATHAAVAMPYAEDIVLSIYPEVFVGVDYQDNAPDAAKTATAAAPLGVGLGVALLTLAYLLVLDGQSPSLLTSGLLSVWWLHYTASGIGDLDLYTVGETVEEPVPDGGEQE